MKKARLIFAALIYAAFLLLIFCFRLVVTAGSSMEPTYSTGNVVVYVKPLFHAPQPGDVAVIRHNGQVVLKRIAFTSGEYAYTPCLPGNDDTGLETGTATVMDLPWNTGQTEYIISTMGWQAEPDSYWNYYFYWSDDDYSPEGIPPQATVPEGYVFVVGDNLSSSYDSRTPDFGLVPISEIAGYAVFTIISGSG